MADVHLGCRRYNVDERTRDFFRAWYDIIENYAVKSGLDFLLISGDFFDRRNIDPQAMNHAIAGLKRLAEAGVPVIAIEGNHDQREVISEFSWMRSLSSWGYLKLLEPVHSAEGGIKLTEWDDVERSGSYIDIGKARIFGSHWYGASASAAIPILSSALLELADADRFKILMLHTDVEGQTNRPIPSLPIAKLKELKALTNYVALGHTHKRFEIDNWAFNPGALEPTSIDEYNECRGVFIVDVDDEFNISAAHITDYKQRPFQRLDFDVSGVADPDAVFEKAMAKMRLEARTFDPNAGLPAPIVELTLHGRLGFKNSLLPLNKLRDTVREMTGALHVLVRNQSVPLVFAVANDVSADAPRHEREQRIIEDLILRDNRFKDNAASVATLVLEVKRQALVREPPDKIAGLVEQHLKSMGNTPNSGAGPEQPTLTGLAALERSVNG